MKYCETLQIWLHLYFGLDLRAVLRPTWYCDLLAKSYTNQSFFLTVAVEAWVQKAQKPKKRARTIFAEGQECWQHTGLFCWCVRKGPGLGSRLPCRRGDRTRWPPRGIVRGTQQILTSADPQEAVLLQPLGNSTTQGRWGCVENSTYRVDNVSRLWCIFVTHQKHQCLKST